MFERAGEPPYDWYWSMGSTTENDTSPEREIHEPSGATFKLARRIAVEHNRGRVPDSTGFAKLGYFVFNSDGTLRSTVPDLDLNFRADPDMIIYPERPYRLTIREVVAFLESRG
jgi:hypothetical protein